MFRLCVVISKQKGVRDINPYPRIGNAVIYLVDQPDEHFKRVVQFVHLCGFVNLFKECSDIGILTQEALYQHDDKKYFFRCENFA